MVGIEEVMEHALAQKGDRYVFGSEGSPLDPDPVACDCAELVEWACARAEVTPAMPAGAYSQWIHCGQNDRAIPVERALSVRGALLFAGTGTGSSREAIAHVAFSLGNGTTIEGRGRTWGVGTRAGRARFRFGGLIPGVDYPPDEPGLSRTASGIHLTGGVLGPPNGSALQRLLNRHGRGLPLDGELDPRTIQALQRYLGVPPDGRLGSRTIEALQHHIGADQDGEWDRDAIHRLERALDGDTF